MLALLATSTHGDPGVPGFAIDAHPRMFNEFVTVTVVNATRARGGVQHLSIVNSRGELMMNLQPLVSNIGGNQELTIETDTWPRGMYLVLGAERGNTGIVKLLKVQ